MHNAKELNNALFNNDIPHEDLKIINSNKKLRVSDNYKIENKSD